MKKVISLIACLLVALFVLTACDGVNYAGTYSFRMGKEGDKHMGIYLTLTNEDYEQQTDKKEKKFSLVLDVGSMFDITGGEEEPGANPSEEGKITLNGYYYITASTSDKEKKLHIGLAIIDIYEEPIEIPAESVEKIIYSTINSTSAMLYIPTSATDLFLQLQWYDYFAENYANWSDEIKANYPSDDPAGTHPIPELIELIKQEDENFRDFHTVRMGLAKD